MSAAPTGSGVRDNPALSRYEVYDDGQVAGFTTYKLDADRISFLHTEVAPEFGGRGLGRRLVDEELADARRRNLKVLPYCPFVARVITEDLHRYLDLVPAADRVRFGLPPSGADSA